MKPVIKVENLGKRYQIGEGQKFYTLRDSITNLFDFKKNKNGNEDFWALKDVNFEVKQGESIGVIGRNGAGKSTLLKILSQITPPTTGKITMNGRVASLLEVGTGFHQELTGRENIFLNGAILGLSRAEIRRKFDEIVAFSEIEKFLDTTVKHYSSGMYMRLAFAVAAHLESEILIVDEVLAVGDAQFQKKCLGKMDEVAKKEGRTVLFVSHNMAAIQSLCSSALLLDKGNLVMMGTSREVVSKYLNVDLKVLNGRNLSKIRDRIGGGTDLRLISFDVVDSDGKSLTDVPCGSNVNFELNLQVLADEINNLRVGISFIDRNTGVVVTVLNSYYGSSEVLSRKKGNHKYVFTVNHLPLAPGQYVLNFIVTSGLDVLDWLRDACRLTVVEGLFYGSGQMPLSSNCQTFFTEYTCGFNNNN